MIIFFLILSLTFNVWLWYRLKYTIAKKTVQALKTHPSITEDCINPDLCPLKYPDYSLISSTMKLLPMAVGVLNLYEQDIVFFNTEQTLLMTLFKFNQPVNKVSLEYFIECLYLDDFNKFLELLEKCSTNITNTTLTEDIRIKTLQKEWQWFKVSVTILSYHSDNTPENLLICLENVTELKALKTSLEQSGESWQTALNYIPIIVLNMDKNLVYTWMYNQLGNYTLSDIIGKQDYDLFPFEEAKQLTELKSNVLKTGKGTRKTMTLTINGQSTHCHLSIEPLYDRYQNVIGITSSLMNLGELESLENLFSSDINASKNLELKVQERTAQLVAINLQLLDSEEKFRQLTENIQEVFWIQDCWQSQLLYLSPAYEKIWGRERAEILNDFWRSLDFIHPEDRDKIKYSIEHNLPQGNYDEEYRILRPDGTIRWIRDRGFPISNYKGEITRIAGLSEDITENKDIISALQKSLATFQALTECSPMGIFLCDQQGNFTYTNSKLQNIMGCSSEDFLGDGWVNFIYPEDREVLLKEWNHSFQEMIESYRAEIRYLHSDGKIRYGRVKTAPVLTEKGNYIGHIGIVEDITETRAVERMKKEFISIVSHELRTPLTAIHGSINLLAKGLVDFQSERGKRLLDITFENTERLSRLLNDILDLERLDSKTHNLKKESYNIAELILVSVELMQVLATQNGVTISAKPQAIIVNVDGDKITQVLTNLLSNAIKFSPSGSVISISATVLAPSSPLPPRIPLLKVSNCMALLTIKDQGRGIPPDKLDTIFERFQQLDSSDSRQKGGTGLGLTICKTIIEKHEGYIWADSQGEEGCTFYIILPLPSP